MTRKFMSLVLAIFLIVSLAACGGGSDAEETPASNSDTQSSTPHEPDEVEDEPEENVGEFVEDVAPEQETETEATEETVEEVTEEEKQAALDDAQKLLRIQPFSYFGLIAYLEEFEEHSTVAATYAADNCGADWNEQAVRHAQYYLETQSFTRDELISQLEFEGYTHEQAVNGVDGVGL